MIIGVMGYVQSGKDTAGKILVEALGWERRAFATKLYEMLATLNPYVADPESNTAVRWTAAIAQYGLEGAKERYPEFRRLLQVFATEVVRDMLGADVWVNLATQDLWSDALGFTAPEKNIVFTDVRFPNEVARVKALGGMLVRIERPGVGPVNAHRSEQPIEPDIIINNDGTVEDLQRRMLQVVEDMPMLKSLLATRER